MEIFDAANFFIYLYKQTKYKCDRRKLQKLIIFSDLVYYAIYRQRLLSEKDVVASDRGLAVEGLTGSLYALSFNLVDERTIIEQALVDDERELYLNSALHYQIEERLKQYLIYSFRQFGAYSGEDLTEISRHTEIWAIARNNPDVNDGKCYVTSDIYEMALNGHIFSDSSFRSSLSHDGIMEKISAHMRGLINNDG